MKTIRFLQLLIAMFMLSLTSNCFANNSYREALQQFMEKEGYSVSEMKTELLPTLSGMVTNMGYSSADAEKIAGKFLEEIFTDLALKWMEDSFKGTASEDDLKEANTFFSTEKGALALKHSEAYNNEEELTKMANKIMSDIIKIAKGEKANDITPDAPADYCTVFQQYCKLTKMDILMKSVFDELGQLIANEKCAKDFETYYEKNIYNILVDLGYPTVTKEDLVTLSAFYGTNAGQHISQGNFNMIDQNKSFWKTVVEEFAKYAKK